MQPRSNKFVALPTDYYPFYDTSRGAGKLICVEAANTTHFPRWVEDFTDALLKQRLEWSKTISDAVEVDDHVIGYDDIAALNHLSMLATSCIASHEQKEFTLKTLALEWLRPL